MQETVVTHGLRILDMFRYIYTLFKVETEVDLFQLPQKI